MVNFTFNLVERLPLTQKLYLNISNYVNKNVLDRKLFDPKLIANAFDVLDSFWLKHNSTDWYSESELRVIAGMVLESLKDNDLSSKEVGKLVRYMMSVWRPEIASSKGVNPLAEEVETKAVKGVELYRKLNQQADPSTFVSKVSKAIDLKIPDNNIVNSLRKVFR
jgi:DNA-binding phage protein